MAKKIKLHLEKQTDGPGPGHSKEPHHPQRHTHQKQSPDPASPISRPMGARNGHLQQDAVISCISTVLLLPWTPLYTRFLLAHFTSNLKKKYIYIQIYIDIDIDIL